MDRRDFLVSAAAAPLALRAPLAYATADTESYVALVDLWTGAFVKRIGTRPGPRSIERVGESAIVAHTVVGAVSILRRLGVLHVLDDFEEPRYTAASRDGAYAFVTDSGRVDVASVDVARGRVVARLRLRLWPRHLSLSRDGRTLWVSLGTASPALAVVDVRNPRAPRLRGMVKPPFLAHDVGFAPSGRAWITSGEQAMIAVHGARTLPADGPPQHVTFLGGRAYVTSGADGTLRVYDEGTMELLHIARIPVGSYNVQAAAGRVLTSSLDTGTLCVLDADGRLRDHVRVGASSHDACLARL